MQEITQEMSIYEISKKYPQTSKIFLEYNLFCVGCAASSIETLRQGILGHGMTEETLKEIIIKLNQEIKKPIEETTKPFEITENATNKLIETKTQNNIQKEYLKIKYLSEDNYDFKFTNEKTKDDIIFFKKDLKILIDKTSFQNLRNFLLDYKIYDFGEGFVFERLGWEVYKESITSNPKSISFTK